MNSPLDAMSDTRTFANKAITNFLKAFGFEAKVGGVWNTILDRY